MKNKKLSVVQMLFIVFALFGLDQFTKYLTTQNMQLHEHIPIIGSFFQLTYVENPGMAFGLRMDNDLIFNALSLFALALVIYYFFKLKDEAFPLQLAISFIMSGAFGNLYDRFTRGSVVDFLDVEFFDIAIPKLDLILFTFPGYSMTRWPVFNVADMAVSAGIIIILSYILFIGDPLAKKPEPNKEGPAVDAQ